LPPRILEARRVNETLYRALAQARLSEEDVAAQLGVDPKTVRRWLDGRVPYLRYRWALANLVGLDESDLWPQFRAPHLRPPEVAAIYPRRDAVPLDIWLQFFSSAQREIDVLDSDAQFLAGLKGVMAAVAERAVAGVKVRICLAGLADRLVAGTDGAVDLAPADSDQMSLEGFCRLQEAGQVLVRLHRAELPSSIYRADGELLICQHAHGIPAARSPVLWLRHADGDMVSAYLDAFERARADAQSAAS